MRKFKIQELRKEIIPSLQNKIDNLTKPKGSLGRLEELAIQIGSIQQTLEPKLKKPQNIIFASDHGIVQEGVSTSTSEVTKQQIYNFIAGGAGINMFARQHHFLLKIVDCGVDADLSQLTEIIHRKIRRGTWNYHFGPAMTHEELEQAILIGCEIVEQVFDEGSNILSFGELGIGNTSSSSLWMTNFTGIPLKQCVGAGSGLNPAGIEHKYEILRQALRNYKGDSSTEDIMRWFGGFEMIAATGGMLRAAELGMTIIIDGFIMTNCLLAAARIQPEIMQYCIFSHQGDEAGHKLILDYLKAKPLLNLGLRLGEGSGAICSYPIIESAVNMINEMSCFEKAAVTKCF